MNLDDIDYTAVEVRIRAIMDEMRAKGLSFRATGKSDFSPTGRRFLDVEVVRPSGGSMFDKVWIDECPPPHHRPPRHEGSHCRHDGRVLLPTKPKPGDNVKNLRLTVLKQRW